MAVRVSASAAAEDSAPAKAGAELCVVHLARHANGLDPFRSFLGSYVRHPAGIGHELAIVLKGFPDRQASEPYRRLAEDLCAHWLEVPDDGYDLGAYRRAALALRHRRVVFLNSFSVIRADRWLELLRSLASTPGTGAIGASGSWGSQSSHARYNVGLGGPYRPVFADPQSTHRVFAGISPDTAPRSEASASPDRGPKTKVGGAVAAARSVLQHTLAFPGFPSPHLRTNCILIERELWLHVCDRVPAQKLDAHRFENGRRGLAVRLGHLGLGLLVAGCDGRSYGSSEWPASRTFWQGDQENLLVEDNQTRAYQEGDEEVRRVLAGYAWGPSAQPAVSAPATVA